MQYLTGSDRPIDITGTYRFEASARNVLPLLLVCAFGFLIGTVALRVPIDKAGDIFRFLGYLIFVMMAPLLLLAIGQLITGRGLAIGPDGIQDDRLSRQVIPWQAIRQVILRKQTRRRWGQTTTRPAWIELMLEPSFESQWRTYPIQRWYMRLNRLFGLEGVMVSKLGLDVDLGYLFTLTEAFRNEANRLHSSQTGR
jgi:hypothetical protein